MLMYACGLRISEAASLEVSAIDSANFRLRIIGKGDKERLVPLPQAVLNELRILWRTHRHPRWLFPNRHRTQAADQQVLCRTFKAAAQKAGIAVGYAAFTAPQLCDKAPRKRCRHQDRTNPARTFQYRHHRHLHPPDRTHQDLAQRRTRESDERPLALAIRDDRNRGRLPPLCG